MGLLDKISQTLDVAGQKTAQGLKEASTVAKEVTQEVGEKVGEKVKEIKEKADGHFCPSCGAEVKKTTKFCPSCGKKI